MPMLQACVESVLSQGFEDWELLISDNRSSDGTPEYLATLTDPRIRVFTQTENLGALGNLNFLFQNARAPISQILCHDDYLLEPRSLSRIVNLWSEAAPEVGFIRANWNKENARHVLESYACDAVPRLVEPQDSDLYFFIFGCILGNLSNVSLRTSLIEEMGGFDQSFPNVGDFEFWIRTARRRAFLLEQTNVTHVRYHPGQASQYLNRHGEVIAQLFGLVDGLFDRLKGEVPIQFLRAHATLAYDALQRWTALRRLLRDHDREYLDVLDSQVGRREAFPHATLRWTVFFLSGGGHWGKTLFARRLLAHRRRLDSNGHIGKGCHEGNGYNGKGH